MPSIAIIGASNVPSKFGNKAVRAYLRQGWKVFPINPTETEVEGLRAYARITDVPATQEIERASLYVPPAVGETLLEDIAARGIKELWVNPGAGSESLLARAQELGLEAIEACSIVDIGERP